VASTTNPTTTTTTAGGGGSGGSAFQQRKRNYETMMGWLASGQGQAQGQTQGQGQQPQRAAFVQHMRSGDIQAIAQALDPAAERGTRNQEMVQEMGRINRDITRVAAMVFAESVTAQRMTLDDHERCLQSAGQGARGSTTVRSDMSVLAEINVCILEAATSQHMSELYRLMLNSVGQLLN